MKNTVNSILENLKLNEKDENMIDQFNYALDHGYIEIGRAVLKSIAQNGIYVGSSKIHDEERDFAYTISFIATLSSKDNSDRQGTYNEYYRMVIDKIRAGGIQEIYIGRDSKNNFGKGFNNNSINPKRLKVKHKDNSSEKDIDNAIGKAIADYIRFDYKRHGGLK